MRIGHGAATMSVPADTPLGGYIDRPGPSTGVLDALEVAAITWNDGRRRFTLAVADVICVNEDLAAQARSSIPEAGQLWLAATHTHAGPETGCVPGGAPTPQPWRDLVTEATRDAVLQAVAAERPASGRARHGELRDVGADRSRPSAEPAVPLDVLAVRDATGALAGVLVVLPVHPTVLPAANLLVSADLAGAVRTALRARLGPDVWVVVATGAAGDISTRHTRRGADAPELARLGSLAADRCMEILGTDEACHRTEPPVADDGEKTLDGRPDRAEIAWAARRLRLAREAATRDPAELVAELRAAHAEAVAGNDPVAARMARSRLDGARVLAGQREVRPAAGWPRPPEDATEPTGQAPPGTAAPTGRPPADDALSVEVGAVRLGGFALAGLPGEPFLGVRDLIRQTRPEPTLVLGYVNGYPGYLPTADAYARAEYEVLAAQVARGAAELVARTAGDLLHELDRKEA
ncbi:hypothetical protein [Nonomuraea sp. LPB2021202275-12-8]|uniref:hypothetical protein n=1 Tax=Nonomuraea sp. LPB2021202275-12-8 TaxID=3120159 RepID=UPI00300C46FD